MRDNGRGSLVRALAPRVRAGGRIVAPQCGRFTENTMCITLWRRGAGAPRRSGRCVSVLDAEDACAAWVSVHFPDFFATPPDCPPPGPGRPSDTPSALDAGTALPCRLDCAEALRLRTGPTDTARSPSVLALPSPREPRSARRAQSRPRPGGQERAGTIGRSPHSQAFAAALPLGAGRRLPRPDSSRRALRAESVMHVLQQMYRGRLGGDGLALRGQGGCVGGYMHWGDGVSASNTFGVLGAIDVRGA